MGMCAWASGQLHAYAEDELDARSPWSAGLKEGISLSRGWGYEKPKDEKFKVKHPFLGNPAFTASIYGEYAFNNYFGLELGVGYLKQGDTATCTNDDDSNYWEKEGVRADCLIMPVGVCIYPGGRRVGKGIWKIFVGMSFNYALRIKELSFDKDPGEDNEERRNDVSLIKKEKEYYNRADFALVTGWSYEWDFGLFVENRGMLGLRGVANMQKIADSRKTGMEANGTTKVKNFACSLTIGYNVLSKVNT